VKIRYQSWVRLLPLGVLTGIAGLAYLNLPDNRPKLVYLGQDGEISRNEKSEPTTDRKDGDSSAILAELSLAEYQGNTPFALGLIKRLESLDSSSLEIPFHRGVVATDQGNLIGAEKHLRTLKDVAPRAHLTQQLQSYLNIQRGENKNFLRQARSMASKGDFAPALGIFGKIFPHGMPTLALRLEALTYQSQIDTLWLKTRTELEVLNRAFPNLDEAQLLLADHLFQRYPHEPWVYQTYEKLAVGDSKLAKKAAASWLYALDGQRPTAPSITGYATLASRYPSDMNIQISYRRAMARFIEMNESLDDPFYRAREEGLAFLKQDRIAAAESHLRYALTGRWGDERALAGMGMVYQRQGDHRRAVYYFQRALNNNQNPDLFPRWRDLKRTSSYWYLLDQADRTYRAGAYLQASQFLQQALTLNGESPHVFLKLAEVAKAQKQYSLADGYYQAVLRRDAMNETALWGRVTLSRDVWGIENTLTLIEQLSSGQRRVVAQQYRMLTVEHAMLQVHNAKSANSESELRGALEHAIALSPESPWDRTELAETLLSLGEKERADRMMKAWTEADARPEMRYAYSLFLERREQLEAAIQQLESIPGNERTTAMAQNLDRLRLNLALEPLQGAEAPLSHRQIAYLEELQIQYANNPGVMIRLANLWLDFEHRDNAEAIYQRLATEKDLAFEVKLRFGSLMLRLEHYNDFPAWYVRLATAAETNEQLTHVDALAAQYYYSKGQTSENAQQYIVAYSMYRRAATVSWPGQNNAKIALLRVSASFEDKTEYKLLSEQRIAESNHYSVKEILALSAVLHNTGNIPDSQRVLRQLENRDEGTALEMRDAMHLAIENKDWKSAENLAHLALARQQGDGIAQAGSPREHYESAEDHWLSRDVKAVLDTLHDRTDGHIKVGLDLSDRPQGESIQHIPVELRLPLPSLEGHLLLRMDYARIDSGNTTYLDPMTSSRLPISEKADGMALGIGWEASHWRADIGTTPLGFRSSTLVGGVALRGKLADALAWRLALSRRPETSDTLAYGGMQVPSQAANHADQEWGGVVATGLKVGLSKDAGTQLGYWGNVQYHQLTGESVESNSRLALQGGLYWRLINEEARNLRVGTNLMYMHYEKNLNERSFGLADYFSPQRFIGLSIPVRLSGRLDNNWSYLLAGTITQSSKEEDLLYGLSSGANSGSGFAYWLEAAIEKRLSKRWYVGLAADIRRSDFYDPNHIQLYVKYTFSDRWQGIPSPPEPVDLYSDFE
jgi:Tfp pilus assembly protein PilF